MTLTYRLFKSPYLKMLVLIIFILSNSSAYTQTKYEVTAEVLNVRSGPGMTFNNVGQLSKGDVVVVYDFKQSWAKITFNDSDGYISKNFLQLYKQEASDHSSNSSSSDNSGIFSLVIAIVVVGVCWFIYSAYERRCNKCKKWNVMKDYDRELVSAYASRKTVNRTVGNRTVTSVPTEVEHYRVYRQCSKCGFTDYVQKRKEVEK